MKQVTNEKKDRVEYDITAIKIYSNGSREW